MADSTKKLIDLLQPAHSADVRRSAALVLGELGERDGPAAKALCASLQDDDASVRLQAIRTAGKLKLDAALPRLLELVDTSGEQAEQAALAAARLGAKGTRALQDLMPKVAPGLRRYIASALAAGGTSSSESAAVAVLLDTDPGVVEATERSLISQAPNLTAAQRRGWCDQLLELLSSKKTRLSHVSESAIVRLLAALDDRRAENRLWDRIGPPHPTDVRVAALQALGKWEAKPGKEPLKRLFACALERDFHIAAPALMILKALPAGGKTATEWIDLLQAPDVAVRHVAIEKLADVDKPEVARAFLAQLSHPDRALRDDALNRLTRLNHGRGVLIDGLADAATPDAAWSLARAQAPHAAQYPSGWRDKVFAAACRHVEAGDRRMDPLLYLLRETDAADHRDRLLEKAGALRKKKDYEKALLYYRLLTRDPAAGLPIRLEQAACGLRASSHDVAHEARAADPCLQQFAHLIQMDDAELFAQLAKIKWLEPEDLYYLGFHFAEQEGAAKRFAGQVLELVMKRSPKSKTAQAAKRKLRGAGLA